jgi:hypothetical protein
MVKSIVSGKKKSHLFRQDTAPHHPNHRGNHEQNLGCKFLDDSLGHVGFEDGPLMSFHI